MGNNLKQLRIARGWTQEEAAQRVNVSRGQYIKLERGERRLTSDYIRMAANAFSVPDAAIISDIQIPVTGYLDGDAVVHPYPPPVPGSPAELRAPALLLTGKQIVALENRERALGNAFRDWILYYSELHVQPELLFVGRLCIAGLSDDRTVLRILTHTPDSGSFGLAHYLDRSEEPQPFTWISPLLALCPR